VSQIEQEDDGQASSSGNPNRLYIIIAAVLLVVIAIAVVLLITQGIPALRGEKEPTVTAEAQATSTRVPTFTPAPTREPTDTPPPTSPAAPALVMSDTDTPSYELDSAGARPGVEWTGFFGQVQDTAGNPVQGISVIIWYPEGQPAAPVAETDSDGYYEIHLADAPHAGTWTIQLLTDDGQPASKLNTFKTDTNTETGIQQIQVIWKQIP
jgi:hypothetical protein